MAHTVHKWFHGECRCVSTETYCHDETRSPKREQESGQGKKAYGRAGRCGWVRVYCP
ncbi:hypothetical protein BX070DRAFT_133703 [Coemansia spiralis]|nr:hypothetical protein BX070DRAFT_133703 [Coemansia spiralis]